MFGPSKNSAICCLKTIPAKRQIDRSLTLVQIADGGVKRTREIDGHRTAAALPCALVTVAPSWPSQGSRLMLAVQPDKKSKLPLRRKDAKVAAGGVIAGSVMLRASSFSYTDMRLLSSYIIDT
jgi:hypothetical protein